MGTETIIRDGKIVSTKNRAYFRKRDKDGNIIEEKIESLDEPFYLLPEEEKEDETVPKIIEVSGNEMER
jgi:hypothetical protein